MILYVYRVRKSMEIIEIGSRSHTGTNTWQSTQDWLDLKYTGNAWVILVMAVEYYWYSRYKSIAKYYYYGILEDIEIDKMHKY